MTHHKLPDSNNTINANETISQSYSFGSSDFIIIAVGIVIGISLIIFVLSRLNRQLDSV